jgi:hypothetical protein
MKVSGTDPAEWRRRLRQDRATNIALIAGYVAMVITVLARDVVYAPTRAYANVHGSPVWLILLPLAFWVWGALAFAPWALRAVNDADVQCELLVAKLIGRRSVMLGLNVPAPMTLRLVEPATVPKNLDLPELVAIRGTRVRQTSKKPPEVIVTKARHS